MVLPPEFVPSEPTSENYQTVTGQVSDDALSMELILVAVLTTIGQIIFSSMAAYAFARMQFRGRDKLFLLYLATMMVPTQVTMIPQFILIKEFGWLDSYQGLIIPTMFAVFRYIPDAPSDAQYSKGTWRKRHSWMGPIILKYFFTSACLWLSRQLRLLEYSRSWLLGTTSSGH